MFNKFTYLLTYPAPQQPEKRGRRIEHRTIGRREAPEAERSRGRQWMSATQLEIT